MAHVFEKLPAGARHTATEVALEMAANMGVAVQDTWIELRRAALKEENQHLKLARKTGKASTPVVYENGDTTKQLLARSQ